MHSLKFRFLALTIPVGAVGPLKGIVLQAFFRFAGHFYHFDAMPVVPLFLVEAGGCCFSDLSSSCFRGLNKYFISNIDKQLDAEMPQRFWLAPPELHGHSEQALGRY